VFDLLTQIELGDGFWYNVLPIGKFHDPRYGIVRVTPKLVKELAGNFGKVPAYEPPVKLGHGDGAASPGVIKKVEARADGLWIQTDFQDNDILEDVRKKKYRYMSVEYTPDYMEKSTGKTVGPALLGVALTNQPAHPGVTPIVFSEGKWAQALPEEKTAEEEAHNMEMEKQLTEALQKVTELTQKVQEQSQKFSDLEKENTGLKEVLKTSQESLQRMEMEKHEATVNAFCEKQVAAGIPPAVVDKVKPVLMATRNTIKLSDKEETNLQVLFGEVFEGLAKVEMGFRGKPGTPEDTKAVKMADEIASMANGLLVKEDN
jgi:flagellar hook-basal body complex protein FliE